jgi:hypothetical protein
MRTLRIPAVGQVGLFAFDDDFGAWETTFVFQRAVSGKHTHASSA